MSWRTTEVGPRYFQVEDGDQVVGAIVARSPDEWIVSIERGGRSLRSGEFCEYRLALAFIEGVEKAIAMMQR